MPEADFHALVEEMARIEQKYDQYRHGGAHNLEGGPDSAEQ